MSNYQREPYLMLSRAVLNELLSFQDEHRDISPLQINAYINASVHEAILRLDERCKEYPCERCPIQAICELIKSQAGLAAHTLQP